MGHDALVPAAQYLRMPTEQQQYSIENQAAAIHAYADRNGFEIVKPFSDAARSGVLFKNRPALRHLLQEVISGRAPFRAILVYDISRWRRFQDSDEPVTSSCASARAFLSTTAPNRLQTTIPYKVL